MKTFIKVKLVVEGIHCYPTVEKDYGKEVDYLQYKHRHNFVIECTLAVSHTNRDKEFICLKHEIQEWLNENFYNEDYKCIDFESMSCEQIGEMILNIFECEMVEVSEDGENSAIVTKEVHDDEEPSEEEKKKNQAFFRYVSNTEEKKDNEYNFKITFVIGPCFAGKSFMINDELFRKVYKDYKIIEVGDIVRKISKQQERVCNIDYDTSIIAVLTNEVVQAQTEHKKGVLIVGLRQLSIFKDICQVFDKCKISIMLVLAEKEVRKKRFESLKNNEKNNKKTFEEIDRIDYELGLYDLITYILTSDYSLVTIKNSEE